MKTMRPAHQRILAGQSPGTPKRSHSHSPARVAQAARLVTRCERNRKTEPPSASQIPRVGDEERVAVVPPTLEGHEPTHAVVVQPVKGRVRGEREIGQPEENAGAKGRPVGRSFFQTAPENEESREPQREQDEGQNAVRPAPTEEQ